MRILTVVLLMAALTTASVAGKDPTTDDADGARRVERLPPLTAAYVGGGPGVLAAEPVACIRPEQLEIQFRSLPSLCREPRPVVEERVTVQHPHGERREYYLSLDEALYLALQNADVIRVVNGTFTTSTGSTIFDPAITNTQIDQARGRFDPVWNSQNLVGRTETPFGVLDPMLPDGARIDGTQVDSFQHTSDISQVKPHGGTARLGYRTQPTRTGNPLAPLDPQRPNSWEASFTQPLLRGRGLDVNQAPIVIARIDTERSFYQLKGSVQELVRSMVESYWGIVAARVTLWARQQQVQQLERAYDRLSALLESGIADVGDTAQSKVSLANFRAAVIAAEAELLNREEALAAGLGLPPGMHVHIVPSTAPLFERTEFDLQRLLEVAQANRPDIAERKLQLEASCQRLLVAENNVLPQVDATALYRWNGLRGETPTGDHISTGVGDFRDWQVGLGMSVPLGQRTNRAALRQVELGLAREKVNLQQQVLEATHEIAQSIRNLDQFYAQYEAYKAVREAATTNLERQFKVFEVGGLRTEQIPFLNVLQAVTDWGNAISNEALAITQYNAEMARLSRAAGTILEDHGVAFLEESYASIGPRLVGPMRCYPESTPPSEPASEYLDSHENAEKVFNLQDWDLKTTIQRWPTENEPPTDIGQPSGDQELRNAPVRPSEPLPPPNSSSAAPVRPSIRAQRTTNPR